MVINQANLDTLRQGLNTRFRKGLQSAPKLDVARIATMVPSTTAIENYPMGAFLDTIRKWVGPRQLGMFKVENLKVQNEDYEATIAVPANAIEDDQVGIYGEISEGKGRQCAALWAKLAIEALVANGKWLDGNAFFYATRKFGKQTINNHSTSALSDTNFNAAYLAMQSYLGYDGEPLGINPDLLVVGPKLRTTAFEILKAQVRISIAGSNTAAAAVDNPNQGIVDFIVSDRLVGVADDYWFLMDTTQVVKPVLVQKRKEGPLVALDRPTDPNVFFGGIDGQNVVPGGLYVYGAHYRGAAALTLPHLCHGNFAA